MSRGVDEDLMDQIDAGNVSKVKELLDGGFFREPANINFVGKGGQSPIILAASNGDRRMVETLLEYDPLVDARGKVGDRWSALFYAAVYGKADIVNILLQAKANPSLRDKSKATVLHVASVSHRSNTKTIRLLLQAKARVDSRDGDKSTPLMMAAQIGQDQYVEALLRAGAGVDTTDKDGSTPLMYASSNGKLSTVRMILRSGADMNRQDKDGFTALMDACKANHHDVVQELVEAGAMIIVKHRGRELSALDVSRSESIRNIVRKGLEPGFKPTPPLRISLKTLEASKPTLPIETHMEEKSERPRTKRRAKTELVTTTTKPKSRASRPPSSTKSASHYTSTTKPAKTSRTTKPISEDDDSSDPEYDEEVFNPLKVKPSRPKRQSNSVTMLGVSDDLSGESSDESKGDPVGEVSDDSSNNSGAEGEGEARQGNGIVAYPFPNAHRYMHQLQDPAEGNNRGARRRDSSSSSSASDDDIPMAIGVAPPEKGHSPDHLTTGLGVGAVGAVGVGVAVGPVGLGFATVFSSAYLVIQSIKNQASDSIVNKDNCKFLADRCASLVPILKKIEASFKPSGGNMTSLALLLEELENTLDLIQQYSQATWIERFVGATSNKERFMEQDKRLTALISDLTAGSSAQIALELDDHMPYVEAKLEDIQQEIIGFRGHMTAELKHLKQMIADGYFLQEQREKLERVKRLKRRKKKKHRKSKSARTTSDKDNELQRKSSFFGRFLDRFRSPKSTDRSKEKHHRKKTRSLAGKKGTTPADDDGPSEPEETVTETYEDDEGKGVSRSRKKKTNSFDGSSDELSEDEVIQLFAYTKREFRIGKGTFGTVYKGEFRGVHVAIKEVDVGGDVNLAARAEKDFKSEVDLLRRLRCSRLVQFVGACTRSPNLLVITEYVPGGHLRKLISENNRREEKKELPLLNTTIRLRIAVDIAVGLSYLHQHRPSIIHRDLKSTNVLLDETKRAKICDFGLSKTLTRTVMTTQHNSAGTPQYMSPEALRGKGVTVKSDIYSFGILLLELFTGEVPWRELSMVQIVTRVLVDKQSVDVPQRLPDGVRRIIKGCLSRNPQKRWDSATVLRSLRALLDKSAH